MLIIEQLSDTRGLTPEGYLLCEGVTLARTGSMLYGAGEIPVAAKNGRVIISRGPEELFNPETIASFVGKAVTLEHPPEKYVSPKTFTKYSKGTVLNPRRGEGEQQDILLGDLLFMDEAAIQTVLKEKDEGGEREVSAGYVAAYEEDEPGKGRQVRIIGNHVALVKSGRCGPRCAIGDQSTVEQEPEMAKENTAAPAKKTNRIMDAVRKVFADAGENLAEVLGAEPEAGGSGDDGHTHVHIHTGVAGGTPGSAAAGVGGMTEDETEMPASMGGEGADAGDPTEKRFQALEAGQQQMMAALGDLSKMIGALVNSEEEEANQQNREGPIEGEEEATPPANGAEEAPAAGAPTEDSDESVLAMNEKDLAKAAPTADAALSRCYKATIAAAEILVPGFKAPTVDSKGGRKAAVSTICGARRLALATAYATADGATVIDAVRATKAPLNLDKMGCSEVSKLFHGAAGAKALLVNRTQTVASRTAAKPGTRTADNVSVGGKKPVRTVSDLNKFYEDHYKGAGH